MGIRNTKNRYCNPKPTVLPFLPWLLGSLKLCMPTFPIHYIVLDLLTLPDYLGLSLEFASNPSWNLEGFK